jgi:hypothetical protein
MYNKTHDGKEKLAKGKLYHNYSMDYWCCVPACWCI